MAQEALDADIEGQPFLTTEFLEGRTLRAELGKVGALGPARVATIGIQIAKALRAAHFLDSMIRSQEPDDVWAENMRGVARAAFKELEGVRIDSVECGQTLCRLEVLGTAPDGSDAEQVKLALARVAPANSEQTLRASVRPAPPKLIVYMTRENTRLPNPIERYRVK